MLWNRSRTNPTKVTTTPLAFPVELRCFARALPTRWDQPKPDAVLRYRYTANGRFAVEPEIVEVLPPPILGFPADEQSPEEPTPGRRRSADQRRSDAGLELEALIAQWETLRPIVSPELAALVGASLKATTGLLGRKDPDDRLRSTIDDLVDVANQLEFELEHQAVRSEPVADGAAVPVVEKTPGIAEANEPAADSSDATGGTAEVDPKGGKTPSTCPDGPCDPYTWRLNGEKINDQLQPAAWKMIAHLWTLPEKFASFDELIVPTYDDHDHVADGIAFGSLRRAGNAFFEKHGIPQRVSLKGASVLLKSR